MESWKQQKWMEEDKMLNDGQKIPMSRKLFAIRTTTCRIWELRRPLRWLKGVILILSWAVENQLEDLLKCRPTRGFWFSKSGIVMRNWISYKFLGDADAAVLRVNQTFENHWPKTQKFTAVNFHQNQLGGFYTWGDSDSMFGGVGCGCQPCLYFKSSTNDTNEHHWY